MKNQGLSDAYCVLKHAESQLPAIPGRCAVFLCGMSLTGLCGMQPHGATDAVRGIWFNYPKALYFGC